MKKVILSLCLLCTALTTSWGQETTSAKLQKQFKISYQILAFEASYELPISDAFSLEGGIGIGAGNYVRPTLLNSKELGAALSFESFPPLRFRTKVKYVYNREKRLKAGKNIAYNSGNYLALQSLLTTAQRDDSDQKKPANNTLITEVHWGLQRSLGGNWLFNVYAGIGYAYDFHFQLGKIHPAIGLEFSYVLF